MTVSMTLDNDMFFTRPTIAGKRYIVKGPSGWTEVIPRAQADAELTAFAKPAPVHDIVDMFVSWRELERTPTDWWTIVGFLGRTLMCNPKTVPHAVGIAFWGHVVLATSARGAN